MNRNYSSKYTIVFLIVIILLFMPTNWVNAALPIIDPDTLRQDDLELSDLDLLQATSTFGPWTEVPGSLSGGFTMQLDPSVEYYYFDTANLVVNRPLANDLYPFYLDTTSLPADFYTYWEARGVTASASGGWEEIMWDIITGAAPMFYLKVAGTTYDLIDGLQYLVSSGTLEAPLRVNGDYPLGIYSFNGTVEDELGYTDDIVVPITFVSPFELSTLDLLESTNQVDWTEVPGSLSGGFTMQLDPGVTYYYFDSANLVVNRPLANDLYPFNLDTVSLPVGFYAYWEARGVHAGATSGWQMVMWDIINGVSPMFYLKVAGTSYDLVDGLQYLASGGILEEPLRVNGDYPIGVYSFNGAVKDESGCADDVVVAITFISPLELSDLDLFESNNQVDWTGAYGNFVSGFTLPLDPVVEYYYFDAANLVVNRPLEDDLYPFYLDTTSLPVDFYTYWEARGVHAGATSGWQMVMWDIITGTAPMFYLKVEGTSYDLVDGLQYLASGGTLEEPLRVNGDYPLGEYNFTGMVNDEYGYSDDVVVLINFVVPLELSDLDLLESNNQIDWTDAPGSLSGGFTMQIDPGETYYYLDVDSLVVNRPLANDLYPFYLDTASLPADFYTYWEARGVTASASGGWEEIMWDIINGDVPMFFLKVESTSYDLVDGLQYVASGGTLEAPLRVNGDYPLGTYSFEGVVEDESGCPDDIVVAITFISPLELSDLDLFESTNQVDWTGAYGNFVDGFTMLLDPDVTYYYLDVDNLVVNRPLENDLYPFHLDTISLPVDFYTYWEARGVHAGATSGWQMVMWDIITGTAPMFYLKVEGTSYDLVDGLQYLASEGTVEAPLRVNGNYPLGVFIFNGIVEDDIGFTDDVSVRITFNDVPVANDQNVSTDEDTALGITLTASDDYPGTLIWDYSQPEHGTVSGTAPNVTYHPDENWFGVDTFDFSVDDGNYGTDSGVITITVNPVNDPPVVYAQSVRTLSNTPLEIVLEAKDVDGDSFDWYRGEPLHGTLLSSMPNLTYTPDADYIGPDSFTFWVEDAEYESERVVVSIMVYEEFDVTVVNLEQSINQTVWLSVDGTLADGYKMDLDTGVAYYYLDVTTLTANRDVAEGLYPFKLETGSVPEGFYTYWAGRGVFEAATGTWEPIMWQIINGDLPMFYLDVASSDIMLVDGLIYELQGIKAYLRINGDYWPGVYNFSGLVSDELGYTDELNIAFTLNDIPVTNSQSVTTEVNTTLNIVLSAIDLFGEPLVYKITKDPSNGVLSGTLPDLEYYPVTDFIGVDSFEFTVTDANGAVSQVAVISIRVHEPSCLVVDPTFLEKTLLQDTSDTQILSITNTCDSPVNYDLNATITLLEGFEDGIMPPSGGWVTSHEGDSINQWTIAEAITYPDYVFDGSFSAWINFDPVAESNEWLFTPVLDISSLDDLRLKFMAYSDTEHPGANMIVWVTDENYNNVEKVWDMFEDENWSTNAYRNVAVDLSAYDRNSLRRIGWQYIGKGGQSFGLDMIELISTSEATWLSPDSATGTIASSATQDVTISFDSSGLEIGNYYAALSVENIPYPEIKIPVSLNVKGDDLLFYLPLIIR